jgi:hypothetical protein
VSVIQVRATATCVAPYGGYSSMSSRRLWSYLPLSSFLAVSCVTSGSVPQPELIRVESKLKALEVRVQKMETNQALKDTTPSECDCEPTCETPEQEDASN